MELVDWRALYASNQAAIERAGGRRSDLPAAFRGAPSPPAARARPAALAGGGLRVDVHAPPGMDRETAVPLVCMLHGCTQSGASFAAASRMNEAADRHRFVVVYPEQDRGQNPQACWNWFLPEHQGRGAGEPAAIVAAVRKVMGTTSPWTIDGRRVFVAGFSAGGAMAAILAATYPDLFAAVAVHSGLAYRSAGDLGAAFAAMARGAGQHADLGAAVHAAGSADARAVPSIVIHGTADQTVAPVNGDQVLAQSMAANRLAAPQACGELDIARPTARARGRLDGGHAYTRARWTSRRGALMHERLEIEGLGHAWSGGAPGHPHTDPRGPDASEAIWRFFREAATDGAATRPPS